MLTIKTPAEYINQPGIVTEAGRYIKKYGKKALILGSRTPLKVVGKEFCRSLKEYGIDYIIEEFSGFPTMEAVERYAGIAVGQEIDLIIGIGGGKVNDTAKAAGSIAKLPVIAIPTIAATCAAWAACSILYQEDGDFDTVYWNEFTPRLILADTKILATAPARYLNAGIVDTLAKWIETEPNLSIAADNLTLRLSVEGAQLAYETLVQQGQQAVEDGQQGIITKAVADTIDAVIYLAGFVGSFTEEKFYGGFAHPFYYATTRLPHTRHRLHGDKVALGLIIQLVLEKKPESYIIETIREFARYGLALTLEDIGIKDNQIEDLHTISYHILKDFPGFTQLGYGKTPEEIEAAIESADALIKKVLTEKQ
jgi:glycerol dehydrogenase-like iron-containing ADH family enzyme